MCRIINCTSAVVHCSNPDTTDKRVDFNDLAILPVRPVSYSGDGNSFAPSFRSTNSGRLVQPSTKSAFRLIKAGKVFDRNNFHAFRAVILQFQSGIRSNSRYIHLIKKHKQTIMELRIWRFSKSRKNKWSAHQEGQWNFYSVSK